MPPVPKKRGFSLQGFDVQAYRQSEAYVQAVDAIYNEAVNEFAAVASKVNFNPNKPFSFNDYPQAKKKADEIVRGMSAKMKSVIVSGTRNQWLFACKKNDEFLAHILDTSKVSKKLLQKYQDRNLDALSTFQTRKINGLDLSQRIWNYTGQMKDQMELGIDIALGDGRSANALSRDLRQYLVDPDKLFRRVRDKHGNLVLSKNAKAFHPGQGKYRSSYKNAMRLTRTEVNMAYRESDQLRWDKLDFIVGFEVKLSNNHTLNGKPFVDICDDLKGKYPKTFKFKGWHPQCRCHANPILMDPDEFNTDELNELKAAIKGTEYKQFQSRNAVNDVPQGFKDWVNDNAERIKGWKTTPFFIKDNFVGGNIAGGLKVAEIAKIKPPKPVKTPEQREEIQKKWNTRQATNKYSGEIQSIAGEYASVDAIKEYSNKINAQIKAGASVDSVAKMVARLKNKVEVKKAWEVRKVENKLGKLIPDPKANIAQYGIDEVQNVYNAVEKKLAQFEALPLSKQQEKLSFEIDWVEKNKKYSTWKLAQDAYKKALVNVEYKIAKQDITEGLADSFEFAKSTMSKNVKAMAAELKKLLDSNASLSALEAKSNALILEVQKLEAKRLAAAARKAKANGVDLGADAYSKARKDAAMWAKDVSEADNRLRDRCGEVWRSASVRERDAAYYYTHTYSSINEPLRGIPYYGAKSVKTSQAKVPYLTSIIDKSTYDFDIWVQRGVGTNGFQGVFGINIGAIDPKNLSKELVGKVGTEKAFSSCGVAKGTGFSHSSVIYNIYCPKGTKMLYAEPFSHYGNGAKSAWDGLSKQYSFGGEAEMIIQKNTKFRITKAEYSRGKYYIDIEVIEQ